MLSWLRKTADIDDGEEDFEKVRAEYYGPIRLDYIAAVRAHTTRHAGWLGPLSRHGAAFAAPAFTPLLKLLKLRSSCTT
jgi:hypothetical protein